jgi:hypothetical protein
VAVGTGQRATAAESPERSLQPDRRGCTSLNARARPPWTRPVRVLDAVGLCAWPTMADLNPVSIIHPAEEKEPMNVRGVTSRLLEWVVGA